MRILSNTYCEWHTYANSHNRQINKHDKREGGSGGGGGGGGGGGVQNGPCKKKVKKSGLIFRLN